MSSSGSGDKTTISDKINELIKDNKVMVFSKTYCMSEYIFLNNKLFFFVVVIKVRIVQKQKKFLVNIN